MGATDCEQASRKMMNKHSVPEFVLRSAEAAANEVIREHQVITFTIEDSYAFVNALLNPPEPNSELRAAFEDYKRDVSSALIWSHE